MLLHTWSLYLKQAVFSMRYGRAYFITDADSLLRNERSEAEEIVGLLIFSIRGTYCNSPSLRTCSMTIDGKSPQLQYSENNRY